eukprot:9164885-Ditylum_brightwellii.AAC.1
MAEQGSKSSAGSAHEATSSHKEVVSEAPLSGLLLWDKAFWNMDCGDWVLPLPGVCLFIKTNFIVNWVGSLPLTSMKLLTAMRTAASQCCFD